MGVGHTCLRCAIGFRAGMEHAHPSDLMGADPLGGSGHTFRAKIGGVRERAGEHGRNVLR